MIKYFAIVSLTLSAALTACASAPASSQPVPRIKPATTKNAAKKTVVTPKKTVLPVKPATGIPPGTPTDKTAVFNAWKRDFISRALGKGYDSKLLAATIGTAKIEPKAIKKNESQPEFTRPIWSYLDGVTSDKRLKEGRAKLALHEKLYTDLEARYGVNRHILTSVWGLESAYGKIMGDDNMINSLATLASLGGRKRFGEQQLYGMLDILARGDVRQDQLFGSWAGAMGMTQFIPTTFRDYAVDYNQDGNKDLWHNAGDALASTASYLNRFGWRPNEPVYTEVILPQGFNYALIDGKKRSVANWAGMGVHSVTGQNWSNDALFLEAKLLTPAGIKGPVMLTFKNFDVIKKYNNSTSYALGIAFLAKGYQNQPTIVRDWPRSDKPLSFSDKKDLQRALTRQGFDTGGVDGKLGPNSRRAIRAWQRANSVPTDGYVSKALLQKIISG